MGAVISYPLSSESWFVHRNGRVPESTTAARSQIRSTSTFAVPDLISERARMTEVTRTFWRLLLIGSP